MSLAHRLKTAQPNASNREGCQSCKWFGKQSNEVRQLINEWLDNGTSTMQLYKILSTPDESGDTTNLIPVSFSGFRNHLMHHQERCR